MFRYALPIILIGVAIAGFFMFTNPFYQSITALNAQAADYNQALDNSKALEAERDSLTQKYNAMDPNNITKLQTLLPDNVDNIRLILEIENIAAPYGMVLKDVKYNTTTAADQAAAASAQASGIASSSSVGTNQNYGSWDLEFSTVGSYENFINLMKDLERNLRIVDIASVQFSSDTGTALSSKQLQPSDSYTYDIKIKTYWLKN